MRIFETREERNILWNGVQKRGCGSYIIIEIEMNDRYQYLEMLYIPRAGWWMIHRDDIKSFQNRCQKVGLTARSFGWFASERLHKTWVCVCNKGMYQEANKENERREEINQKVFDKRKTSNHG